MIMDDWSDAEDDEGDEEGALASWFPQVTGNSRHRAEALLLFFTTLRYRGMRMAASEPWTAGSCSICNSGSRALIGPVCCMVPVCPMPCWQ